MKAKVGIIVPFKKLDNNVKNCIKHILNMDYKNYDIILLPDGSINENFPKAKVIQTGPVVPAVKRNKAIFSEDYELFASIDSDAYPDEHWLSSAVPIFNDKSICAVGGPNLPPKEAKILEMAAIDIVYSKLGVSTAYYGKRYRNGLYETKELASSNLIIRKSDFIKTKGYNTNRMTGEDTILCFDLRKTGKKIIYSPDVKVYHHRRRLFWPHLARVFVQASDKAGILLKSFKAKDMIYFIPALFVLFLAFGFLLSFLSESIFNIVITVLLVYFALVFLDSLRTKSPARIILFMIGMPLTHISYGLGCIYGALLKRK